MQRIKDTLDYHSSPEEAAQTATRGGVGTLVLTHYVPPIPTGERATTGAPSPPTTSRASSNSATTSIASKSIRPKSIQPNAREPDP